MVDVKKEYEKWINYENLDSLIKEELVAIADNFDDIQDRFYQDLTFGTAGLRGKLGAGTNRMNIYTVARATKGLCKVILTQPNAKEKGVAIAYDSRNMSKEFAELVARIVATFGIKAYIFESLRPTPELSYTIRHYGCISGINITASHNPKEYNGYKVYWQEGAQIKDNIADKVLEEINKIDIFEKSEYVEFNYGVDNGLINIIGSETDEAYYEEVLKVSLNEDVDKNINIVYTPLNGAGNVPVREILKRKGYNNVHIVKEQEMPDGNFPTVKYPNPEEQAAFEYAQNLGIKVGAELLLATDPDADRLAVQVIKNNKIIGFNGNQIGVILVNYILESKKKLGVDLSKGAIIKSIVTGEMGFDIANEYGVSCFQVLTGFKNIAELQNIWDNTNEYEFLFGYEESIGYNAGNFVRDKDAVSTALLLVEAAAYYKKQGKDLKDVLDELYSKYGYYAEDTVSIVLEGLKGQQRIKRIMEQIENIYPKSIGDALAKEITDYRTLEILDVRSGNKKELQLEKTNAYKCLYEDGSWFTLRPSGTEPKIKLYIYTKADTEAEALIKVRAIEEEVKRVIATVE